ncbi:MAG: hypothetical protein VR68_12645 [Peptococcaceae bacterium BRH_c4a]|nr:MAG: hypothetical protein VR68_12645 [Peptococcaceae bacterium BRH_c4a]
MKPGQARAINKEVFIAIYGYILQCLLFFLQKSDLLNNSQVNGCAGQGIILKENSCVLQKTVF